jgi:predicted acetyltransferase
MKWREAIESDTGLLAEMNSQLSEDENQRNPLSLPALQKRMSKWLSGEHTAILFERDEQPVAYALYHYQDDFLYLRQFFVIKEKRRQGIGRQAVDILVREVFPPEKRLVVTALSQNPNAIKFWRAVGFSDYCLSLEILPRTQDTE